jgi:hypothetical protein
MTRQKKYPNPDIYQIFLEYIIGHKNIYNNQK